MARTVNTGWKLITPGRCVECGDDDGWQVDGYGNILCECQACPDCNMVDAYGFHHVDCPVLVDQHQRRYYE